MSWTPLCLDDPGPTRQMCQLRASSHQLVKHLMQGLDWYTKGLKEDSDGDVASEFLEESEHSIQTSAAKQRQCRYSCIPQGGAAFIAHQRSQVILIVAYDKGRLCT